MSFREPFLIQTLIILCCQAIAFAAAAPAYNLLKKKYPDYGISKFCNHVWYFLMICFLLAFAAMLIADKNSIFNLIFNANDAFMDFFNPIAYISSSTPYAAGDGACYSGLSFSFYLFISKLISAVPETAGLAIKMSKTGIFMLYAYIFASIAVFMTAVIKLKTGRFSEKILFLFLILFSSPLIYQFERANIIFIANFLIIVFYICYESKNKKLFEAGLICLAAAAAIKIYPAIFALMLIKDKKWKETARFTVYCAVLFIAPFFIFGSINSIKDFFYCVATLSKNSENTISSHWVTIHNFFLAFLYPQDYSMAVKVMRVIFFISGCFTFFFHSEKWKTAAILSMLMILTPARSAQYAVIFMTLPLILFMNSQNKRRKDIAYAVLFAGIFAPLAFKSNNLLTISVMSESISIILMGSFLIYEGVYLFARRSLNKLNPAA